jgi:hypothetical protein
MSQPGPLTRAVLDYAGTVERLVPTVRHPSDWAPLAAFVAVDDFVRVGTDMEVQDWKQYTEMLTAWASAVERFETTVRRVTEASPLVYFEVEERHLRGAAVAVVNSMTVFAFDARGKVHHLDVYLQQGRR